jgi:cell division protein ZapA
MSSGKSVTINLRILDKDYVVACPEEERETLIAAAQYLNQKVQEVRVGGKVVSNERIVVVSALNIIHEYFQDKQQKDDYINNLNVEIRQLQEKIEVALSKVKH